MFTLQQIELAAQNIKSGADFPNFIKQLKEMGVTRNDVFVINGMSVYYGTGDETVESSALYESLLIAETGDENALKEALKIHQQGQTDYFTFCKQAAEAGVEKWITDINVMTVSYLASDGTVLVVEKIPSF